MVYKILKMTYVCELYFSWLVLYHTELSLFAVFKWHVLHPKAALCMDLQNVKWMNDSLSRRHSNIPVEVSKPVPSQGCRKLYAKPLFMCLLLPTIIWNKHQALLTYSCHRNRSLLSEVKSVERETRHQHTKRWLRCHAWFSGLWLWRILSSGIWHHVVWHRFTDVSEIAQSFNPEDGGNTFIRNLENINQRYGVTYQETVML
jgi:hypothetical protein